MEAKDKKISQLETTTDYINSYVPTVTNGINKKLHIGNTFITVVQPIQTTLNSKVDKVEGKQLSTNDFTDTLKTKLDNFEGSISESDINALFE